MSLFHGRAHMLRNEVDRRSVVTAYTNPTGHVNKLARLPVGCSTSSVGLYTVEINS
jgi:hypothetical protein